MMGQKKAKPEKNIYETQTSSTWVVTILPEIWICFFRFLSQRDLIAVSRSCKLFNHCINQDSELKKFAFLLPLWENDPDKDLIVVSKNRKVAKSTIPKFTPFEYPQLHNKGVCFLDFQENEINVSLKYNSEKLGYYTALSVFCKYTSPSFLESYTKNRVANFFTDGDVHIIADTSKLNLNYRGWKWRNGCTIGVDCRMRPSDFKIKGKKTRTIVHSAYPNFSEITPQNYPKEQLCIIFYLNKEIAHNPVMYPQLKLEDIAVGFNFYLPYETVEIVGRECVLTDNKD